MKYIIEIEEKPLCVFDKDTQTYFPRLWRVKGFNSLVFDEDGLSRLEVLNSDYINEHFGDLQDTAYQKGINDGSLDVKQRVEGAYQRGLDDAWEAARKIWQSDICLSIFKVPMRMDCFTKFSASEAIAKLKAYEDKKKAADKIKVGDEVTDIQSGANFLVTHLWESNRGDKGVSGFNNDCSAFSATLDKVSKTGRHFDIHKILKEMKE